MTGREVKLAKAILMVLHDLDGGQTDELRIHAEAQLVIRSRISLAEFSGAIALCNTRGWITGVPNRFTDRMKWNLNDAGESALLEL